MSLQEICDNKQSILNASNFCVKKLFWGLCPMHLNMTDRTLKTIGSYNAGKASAARMENVSLKLLGKKNENLTMNKLCYKFQKKIGKNYCTSTNDLNYSGAELGKGCCVTVVDKLCK